MTNQNTRRNIPTGTGPRRVVVALVALFGIVGFAACSDDVKDVLSFVEYAATSAEVLDDNGFEPESDIDCDGSTGTNEVTCTGTTADGLRIESTGENLGEDSATLVVKVDGEVIYDGLLDDAS